MRYTTFFHIWSSIECVKLVESPFKVWASGRLLHYDGAYIINRILVSDIEMTESQNVESMQIISTSGVTCVEYWVCR